ncbi:RsiV family protein [Psychrobacter sp. 2Y5]|uniref:RsiV family protein n=1 Tax=unclassified Psychrobacter TaxID=196806 RepID=UPI003F4693C6
MSSDLLTSNNKAQSSYIKRSVLAIATGSLLSISLAANASSLISSTEYLDYEFPVSVQEQCYEKNNCPEIEVKYLNTNQDWLNDIVNKRVNNIVINSKMSESPVSQATDKKTAKTAIDDFVKSQFMDMPEEVRWSYSLTVTPEYLGHVKLGQGEDLELFNISSYVFTGGAHGMPFSEYLIFDPANKQQITLDNMIQTGQQSRFNALAYDAYKSWVKWIDEDVKSYEQNWPFVASEDVSLTDKGVNIRYQPYAIGPYAYGMPVLTIPYSKLAGILKPRFMPSS